MAEILDDAEFWLPSEFLPDEDLFVEKESLEDAAFSLKFPNEFPIEFDSFGSSSVINSPVESTASSSETESSDEEFLAALTQRLAQSALYETKKPASPYLGHNEHEKKNWFVSGSPQSTLTRFGRLSCTGKVSGHGSPNGPLLFPSPPETPFETEKDTWDLVYAAAGQVARLQAGFASSKHSNNTFPESVTHLSAICPSPLPCVKYPFSFSYMSKHLNQKPLQTAQFRGGLYDQVLKDECSMEGRKMAACSVLQHPRQQQFATCERTNGYQNGRYEPLQASARHQWQTQSLGQQPQLKSSSYQASFNGGSCAKRESVGTGVFLPRICTNPPEHRKQTGFPTVRPVKFHGNGLSYNKDTKERSRGPFNCGSGRDYSENISKQQISDLDWRKLREVDIFNNVADLSAVPKYELCPQRRQAYGADAAQKKELLLPLEWTY